MPSESHKLDLSPYQLEMRPIPDWVEEAIELGVRDDLSFPFSEASHILDPGHHPLEDSIIRNPDGTIVVWCRTDMPDVTAHMIDLSAVSPQAGGLASLLQSVSTTNGVARRR